MPKARSMSMSLRPGAVRERAAALLLSLLPLAACTGPKVQTTAVASWREAVGASKAQAEATFKTVNLLVRESQLDRLAGLPKITEGDVAPYIAADALRSWRIVFDQLTTYASSVEALLSPDLPQGVGDSLRLAGEQIGATAKVEALEADKGLSKALGALGQKIVAAAANAKAGELMLAVDPEVKELTAYMANLLYAARGQARDDQGKPIDEETGMLLVVAPTWDDRIDALSLQFQQEGDRTKRRAVAAEYAKLVEQRNECEEAIRSLRRGIVDLGASHTAAAQGRATDLRTLIQSMTDDLKTIREILDGLKNQK